MISKRSLLVWDIFSSQLTDVSKKTATDLTTEIAVILGELTSMLQPLDVGLNKTLRYRLCKMWTELMYSGSETLKKSDNLPKPSITFAAAWVDEAWK